MNDEQENASEKSGEVSSSSPLLSRDAKLILAWVFLNSIPIGYMNVVPLVYLLEVGYAPSLIGLIYAAGAVANTVAYIPFGILADKYGRKIFLLVGGFIPFVSYAIFGLTLNLYLLIFASVLGGVGLAGGLAVAINSPALLPLVAATGSDKDRTNLFGTTQGAWIVALTIGALLSFLPGLLESHLSLSSYQAHSYSYFVMSALIVASTIPGLFIREKRSPANTMIQPEVGKKSGDGTARLTLRKIFPIVSAKRIANLSIIFAFSGLGLGVIVQLVPTWYNLQFGTSESTAGFWIALTEFAGIIAVPVIPRLVKRRGTVSSVVGTAILSAVFLGLMPLSKIFTLAAFLFILRNVFITISWPVLQSYMMGVVEEKERATTIGITYTAWGIAASIGTYVGGELLGAGLLWVPFAIGAAAYVASGLALFLIFRKIKPPEELELASSSEFKAS